MSVDRPNPEANAREVSRRVTNTLNRLLTSPMPEVRDIATNVVTRLRMGEITYTDPTPWSPCPSLTAFELMPDGPRHMRRFKPAIVISPAAILNGSQEQLDADMVRTFAIADQYPTRYTDTYSAIYDRALGTQRRWLDENDITEQVPYDPRSREHERESFKRELLGDARYFCDAGIDDWNKGINSREITLRFITQISQLRDFHNNDQLFINTRQAFSDDSYNLFVNQSGYLDLYPETQRSIIGTYLIGRLLLEFRKAKLN